MTRSPLLIIGLDGATMTLVEPWARAGLLPNLATLIRDGASGTLTSTVPDTTPVAWPSIYTGTNPGKHGMHGFRMRKPGTYQWAATTSADMKRPSYWELAARRGAEVATLFAPFTYPAGSSGWIVSGRGSPRGAVAGSSTPEGLARSIAERFGEELTFGARRRPGMSVGEVAGQLVDSAEAVGKAAAWVISDRDWDVVSVTWDHTDTAAHLLWHHSMGIPDERSEIYKVYRSVDEGIGRVLETFRTEPVVLVCSDHGTEPSRYRVRFPLWLRDSGYLSLKDSGVKDAVTRGLRSWGSLPLPARRVIRRLLPERVAARAERVVMHAPEERIDWPGTAAYPDPVIASNIFLNRIGREPGGTVDASHGEELLAQITERALGIECPDGSPAVASTLRRDEFCVGPEADGAPDLALLANEGVELAPVFDGEGLVSEPAPIDWDDIPHSVGHHNPRGMVAAWGRGVTPGVSLDASVFDIAPTVLRLCGVPVPDDVDGRALEEAFDDLPDTGTESAEASGPSSTGPLTPEQEADVADHLRDLGYIE